jgi:hypothetical protein
MDEAFPIVAGLLLGFLFAQGYRWIRPWWIRTALILAAGVSATILSGEYRENWGFVLVDVGEVALVAWIGFVAARYLRNRLDTRATTGAVRSG